MWTYLLQGLTLGLAAGAQPGPLQTYLINQSLQNGWRRAIIAAFSPLVSDGLIVTLVLVVLNQLPDWLKKGLYLGGGVFLLYLAWLAFRKWRTFQAGANPDPESGRRSLLRGAMMNALNPAPYLFWSLVNGPILLLAWNERPANGLGFLIAFYGSMISLNAALVVAADAAGRIDTRVQRAMLGLSALFLGGFGIFQIWQGIR